MVNEEEEEEIKSLHPFQTMNVVSACFVQIFVVCFEKRWFSSKT